PGWRAARRGRRRRAQPVGRAGPGPAALTGGHPRPDRPRAPPVGVVARRSARSRAPGLLTRSAAARAVAAREPGDATPRTWVARRRQSGRPARTTDPRRDRGPTPAPGTRTAAGRRYRRSRTVRGASMAGNASTPWR